MAYAFNGRLRHLRRAHERPADRPRPAGLSSRPSWPAAASVMATRLGAGDRLGPLASLSMRSWPSSSAAFFGPQDTLRPWACATAARCLPRSADLIPGARGLAASFTTTSSDALRSAPERWSRCWKADRVLRRAWPAAACRSRWRMAKATPTSRSVAMPARRLPRCAYVDHHGRADRRPIPSTRMAARGALRGDDGGRPLHRHDAARRSACSAMCR
jgi:hypothetical protein